MNSLIIGIKPSSRGWPPTMESKIMPKDSCICVCLKRLLRMSWDSSPRFNSTDDAHAFARGLIANVGDAFDFLGLDKFGDTFDETRLVDLLGDFGDDDIFRGPSWLLRWRFGAHDEAAAAGAISGFDAFPARDVCPGGENPGRGRSS